MKAKFFVLILSILIWQPGLAAADTFTDIMSDPFAYFNVYSLGDIGSETAAYGSDFQGTAGAAGDAYFNSFSLLGMDSETGVVLHTGGSATLGGSYQGGLDVGGDLTIGSLSIQGDVAVGGDVIQSGGGHISGNVSAAGTADLTNQMSVGGSTQSGSSYDPLVDHTALSIFFASTSEMIGSWEDTGTVVNQWGLLVFNGTSGVNVITVSAEELQSAWGFTINAPEDAVVYINVVSEDGSTVTLDSTNWSYTGGISTGSVLLNMAETETLYLSQNNHVNILAPFADTYFSSGVVTGSLIVGNLEGSGQVNLGHFTQGGSALDNPAPVPEPGTMVLLGVGLLALLIGAGIKLAGNWRNTLKPGSDTCLVFRR